jgi:hypothetical protein
MHTSRRIRMARSTRNPRMIRWTGDPLTAARADDIRKWWQRASCAIARGRTVIVDKNIEVTW